METVPGNSLLYPIFKMCLGVTCLILAIEYGYAFCVYHAASFGIFYIGDIVTWLLAGLLLFTEGLYHYLQIIRKTKPRPEKRENREYIEVYND